MRKVQDATESGLMETRQKLREVSSSAAQFEARVGEHQRTIHMLQQDVQERKQVFTRMGFCVPNTCWLR
jgi:hypothetical protein